ncbi:threonine--tRNA ligase [Candidatus Micrarchaeota archaeon]|nr:threonine--tRNA ligase [Candidatus Micrarchaeota archaeon]
MKLLTIHADFIEYEALTQAIKSAEPIEEGKKKERMDDCLVAFCAAEQGDNETTAEKAANEIIAIAGQVKAKTLVLYPWVHLTAHPAPPNLALSLLKKVEATLCKQDGFTVFRSPFGWYKSFDVKCKGHPLSELSREITSGEKAEEKVSESLKTEAKMKPEHFILTPEGEAIAVEKFNFAKFPELKKFTDYEIRKVRAYEKEPPHIAMMREHQIASHEAGSDSGNLRWFPKGRLVKKLLEKRVSDLCVDYGAMEVETPIMYDFEHPALKKYLNRFPARQYVVKSEDKELFLRFSACFGQFLMSHDMTSSYRSLPLKMYELTKYSFRREQSGEVTGLRRLRCFTMPDMHTACAGFENAKNEFAQQFAECMKWMKDLGTGFETAFRAQKKWFEENKEWYAEFARKLGKPVFLELFEERYAYFITKFEFNFIDNLDKASALSTVQIDIENAETFDLNYVDEKGEKQKPIMLHASFSGSTDRCVYAMLEEQAKKMKRGEKPAFPIWLSPTQVRVIPISEKQNEYAFELRKKLSENNVRADVDERNDTLQKRIREAEKEWIPFIAVVGEKEVESRQMSVRVRSTGKNENMNAEELAKKIESECEGKPFEKLTLPMLLSKRPTFA